MDMRKRILVLIVVYLFFTKLPSKAAESGAESRGAAGETKVTAAVPAEGEAITLQDAIRIAQQNHGSVVVAQQSVESAQQRVRQARVGTLPRVTGEVDYRGRGVSTWSNRSGLGGTQFDQGLQPKVSVSYTILDGGLTSAEVKQAKAGVQTNEAGLVSTRNNLAFTVASNYLAQLRAAKILELRKAQEQLAATQLESVEARIKAGSAAEADRALVLSEFRNRQVDRIQAENEFRVAANSLRNSMGLPVGPPLRLVELEENLQDLPPVEQLREIALRQRPEVIQAEARKRMAEAGLEIARIQRNPRLVTSAGLNATPEDPTQRSDWQLSMSVTMPLWDAGQSRARVLEAEAELQSAEAELEQLKKNIGAEVEEAYLNVTNARERLVASRLAADAARVNLEATTARYQQGVAGVSVVNLILAQVEYSTASTNAIQALYDVYLAQAQLDKALGRFPSIGK